MPAQERSSVTPEQQPFIPVVANVAAELHDHPYQQRSVAGEAEWWLREQ
jgi:hypothetical protein